MAASTQKKPDQEQPEQAVDYHRFHGAICPKCGRARSATYRTMEGVEGSARERYHGCQNCGHRFKSVEAETPKG